MSLPSKSQTPASPILPPTPPVSSTVHVAYLPMLTAIVVAVLVTVSVVSILLMSFFRPTGNITAFITAIITIMTPTVTALLALLKGQENAAAIQNVHVDINSRLSELVEQSGLAQRAAGRDEERANPTGPGQPVS